MPETPWLTAAQAVDYSHKSLNTINNALRDGSLVGSQTKRYGTWSIHRDNLDAWLRGERAEVKPPRVTRGKQSVDA